MSENININVTESGTTDIIEINEAARGPAGPAGPSGVTEAPEDGNTYGRKDAGWVALVSASSTVIVQSASDLSGVLDSDKTYFIDGIIDMGTQSIEVPSGGLSLTGSTFDVSQLTSSEDSYTMFTSPGGGSGNLLIRDVGLEASGSSSSIYDLTDATGFNAVEIERVNFNSCSSLGEITGYRQGLESGTGRFGGSPNLTLSGTWLGGYFIDTSIVRSLDAGMTGALYEEGSSFSMASRFRSNQNIDLPANAAFFDFAPSDFPNPGTVQMQGCEITRGGTYNADDSNLTPNMDKGDLAAYWKQNNGLPNTFVGGTSSVTSEELTNIGAGSTYYDLEGIFTGSGLEHFSSSADGKLTHLGSSPREFEITSSLVLECQQNNSLTVRFRKWDDSASAFVDLDYTAQTRVVNNLQGGRDVAYFAIFVGAVLDQNDFLQLQVRNNSGSQNVTAELGSFFRVQER